MLLEHLIMNLHRERKTEAEPKLFARLCEHLKKFSYNFEDFDCFLNQTVTIWLVDSRIEKLKELKQFIINMNPELALVIHDEDVEQVKKYFGKVEKRISELSLIRFTNKNDIFTRNERYPQVDWLTKGVFKPDSGEFSYILPV